MTTTNYDDLSIGQVQERAVPYFDFIAPMVYPSHYPHSFLGLGNPNDHPYEVVHHAMQTGVDRLQASTTPLEGFLHEPIMTQTASGTATFTGMYSKPVYGPEKSAPDSRLDYGGDYMADVRAQIQARCGSNELDDLGPIKYLHQSCTARCCQQYSGTVISNSARVWRV